MFFPFSLGSELYLTFSRLVLHRTPVILWLATQSWNKKHTQVELSLKLVQEKLTKAKEETEGMFGETTSKITRPLQPERHACQSTHTSNSEGKDLFSDYYRIKGSTVVSGTTPSGRTQRAPTGSDEHSAKELQKNALIRSRSTASS